MDPPKLDFDLRLPSESHGSGLLDYVSNWADAFICDKILSQYLLPDHYFSQVDGVCSLVCCMFAAFQVMLICDRDPVSCQDGLFARFGEMCAWNNGLS